MKVTRRGFIKALGATFAVAALPIGWVAAHKPRRWVIAASDASDAAKARADLVCIGRADNEMIQPILDRGDSIYMGGGTFYLNNAIELKGEAVIRDCYIVMDDDCGIKVA